MSLNIKNKDVERLIKEVSLLTGESKTEAVRRSLEERRARLAYQGAANDRGGTVAPIPRDGGLALCAVLGAR